MELDDLKKTWAKQPESPPEPIEIEQLERRFSAKTDGLKKALFFEAAAVAAMLAAVAWLWFFGSIYRGLTTKILLAGAAAGAAITFFRLFRVFRKLETGGDFSKNVLENLRSSLSEAEREVKFYRWSAWIFFVFMGVAIFFDKWFLGMNGRVKMLVAGLLALSFWTTRPYLEWLYGRKIKALREQIDAFLSDEKG